MYPEGTVVGGGIGGSAVADGTPALELLSLHKSFRQGAEDVVVLRDVSLRIERGEFVSLVGPSGSGKSTLLHIAGGLDRAASGTVHVAGIDISALGAGDLAKVRRRNIGFIFQFFQLLPTLTVQENVELPLIFDRKRTTRAPELLERIGLGSKATRFPAELSGGEMQRVAIARSLVAGAPLILADEPTGNLDAANAAEVLDLLTEQVRLAGSALLLVTHDAAAARRADRVLSLEDGSLTEP
jgi:ABC-type lipoprotein export system ATPase subunit